MDQLTDDETAILDFERQAWTHAGAKDTAIVQTFGTMTPGGVSAVVRYYQQLNTIISKPAAMAYDPLLVKRLLRLRDARVRQRSARRLGFVEPLDA